MSKLAWADIQRRAVIFCKKWQDDSNEHAEAKSFLDDFFDVFGVSRKRVALFEKPTKKIDGRDGFIDMLWPGVMLIEMKSKGKNLDRAFTQAKDYSFNLTDEQLPDYIMVCDFENIRLYRLSTDQKWTFKTSKLPQNVKLFSCIAGYQPIRELPEDVEANVKAAEKMAKLHDGLKLVGYEGHELEVYLVRLLFCLFSDDTLVWEKNLFHEYVMDSKEDGSDLPLRLEKLFEILDTDEDIRNRKSLLSETLLKFTYINGGLFKKRLNMPDFDANTRQLLLDCCSFDWSNISPSVFGAMFQGVMSNEERRDWGAHYTSKENILKTVRPLFLDALWTEFELIKMNDTKLKEFHNRIANMSFLDPACGCGNFNIVVYTELRLLELNILKMLINERQLTLDVLSSLVRVSVDQFYGFEIADFPAQIATTGIWLADHQMNLLVSAQFGLYYARFPLKKSATIEHGNALRIEWGSIVPNTKISIIYGNPPFIGTNYLSDEQRDDMDYVYGKNFKRSKLDYVTCWYMKAAEYIQNTDIKCAFVSTNSISQGEQVGILWEQLFDKYGLHIDFAYRTFVWSNEAKGEAKVHCVIIGFSKTVGKEYKIFADGKVISAKNINPYLIDAPNIIIRNRTTPICDVPEIVRGSQATDDGQFIFSEDEYNEFIIKEPLAAQYMKRFMMGKEFINNITRYCLWLPNCPPSVLKKMPFVIERVSKVREFRANSKNLQTKEMAKTPAIFGQFRAPAKNYIALPKVSSERRTYIPMDFLTDDTIPGDKVFTIPNATIYHFGVLNSSMHNSWMRTVAGRMKSDYSYSTQLVYNCFPWPDPSIKQKEEIEKYGQAILNARQNHPGCSLADLYDPNSMPVDLTKAHSALDKAVEKSYGKNFKSEEDAVSFLLYRYSDLINK